MKYPDHLITQDIIMDDVFKDLYHIYRVQVKHALSD